MKKKKLTRLEPASKSAKFNSSRKNFLKMQKKKQKNKISPIQAG